MTQSHDRIRVRLAASAKKQRALLNTMQGLLENPDATAVAIDQAQQQLQRATADHTRLLTEWRLAKARSAEPSLPQARLVGQRPMREQVLDILDELGVPASPRVIGEVAAALFGRALPAARFASLRRDEERACRKDPMSRPAWVVPALTAQGLTPIPRIVASSSWESERRLIGARTLRGNHLRTLLALVSMRDRVQSTNEPGLTAHLDALLMAFGQTVPGAAQPGRRFEPERISEAARAELALIHQTDIEERRQAAGRLDRLPLLHRLWGQPALIDGQRAAGRV